MANQQNKIKFYDGITKTRPIKYEKVHNEYIKQYEELPPHAKNKQTGEILNPTDKYIYREIEPKNIHEYIQSNTKEADLVQKIKTMTSGELNAKKGIFIDNTSIGNLHEEHLKTQKLEQELALAEQALKAQKEKEHNAKVIEEYEKQKQLKEKEIKKENK